MATNQVLGLDLSTWEKTVDWDLLKAKHVEFIIARSSQGQFIQDNMFMKHVGGATKVGIPVGVFHWADPDHNAVAQADSCIAMIDKAGRQNIKFVCVDIEQYWHWQLEPDELIIPPNQISEIGRLVCARLECLGIPVVVYTRTSFINEFCKPMKSWIGRYYLWLAQWPIGAGMVNTTWEELRTKYMPISPQPTMPIEGTWKFYQWSGDRYILPGVNAKLDLNLFNGTVADLYTFIGSPLPGQPTEPEVPQPVPCKIKLRVTSASVNVRTKPSVWWNTPVGSLPAGAEVELADLDGSDIWVKLPDGRFVAFQTGGKRYMEFIK